MESVHSSVCTVSIITVAYNSEKTIERTIQSVLGQKLTGFNMEYLIIDGASKDRTVEIARTYEKAFLEKGIEYHIYSQPDKGIYDAMNQGIRKAGGDIIGMINSDDWYEEDAVWTAVQVLATGEWDLLFGNIRMHKADGSTFVKKARLRKFQTSRDWNHPTMFVKASLYKEYPFRMLGIHDDYGFYLQMRRQGRRITTVDKVMADFVMGGASNRKSLKKAVERIRDRYRYCYRINGYSRWYLAECILIESAKMLLS